MSNTKTNNKIKKVLMNVAGLFRQFDADDVNHHIIASKAFNKGTKLDISNNIQQLARNGFLERVSETVQPTRWRNCRSGNMRTVWKKA